MAVAFQAAGTGAGITSVTWPAHVTDDIGLLFVESQATGVTLATPAGFAQIGTAQNATGTSLTVFWCRATSGAMANPAINGASDHNWSVIVTYRGCITTGNPFTTFAGDIKNTASTTTTAPAVTTTISNSLIVIAITKDLDSTAAFATNPAVNANLSGIAERFDAGTTNGNGGGIAVIDGVKATPGSTGTTAVTVTSSTSAMMTIALRPPEPTFTQAAFRLYEDGTEAGSTAIAAQDTNITRDVTSDSNLQLRIRLQDGTAFPGEAVDDYQLQYEKNDSGSYFNIGIGVIDSYDESNYAFSAQLQGVTQPKLAQSLTGDGKSVTGAKFYLRKVGSPTGNATAVIYAHSGTFGTSSVPTGAALATSDTFDVSTLSTSNQLISFNFTGVNQISLTAATNYVLSIEYSGGDGSNRIDVGWDNTSPTHGGNASFYNTTSWAAVSSDQIFYLVCAAPITGYNSASLTDGNATTNRLGSGSGSFVAGKISEDGLVDDHQITASNYTEYLYSLTLVASTLANADTLDFRILRNGATTGLTYTVTPRITVSKTGGAAASHLTLLGVG